MTSSVVDLWYPVFGRSLPSDHGYSLYGALSKELPELHGAPWWGLHTIRGTPDGNGDILLPPRPSLGIRLPVDQIKTVLSLAGRSVDVASHTIRLGPPTLRALEPSEAVSARMVTIKGFLEPEPFREAVNRQLESLKAYGEAEVGERKVVRVGRHTVVGFAVRVSGLESAASTKLQESGVGGRRRFGCGLFRPSKRKLSQDRRPPRRPS